MKTLTSFISSALISSARFYNGANFSKATFSEYLNNIWTRSRFRSGTRQLNEASLKHLECWLVKMNSNFASDWIYYSRTRIYVCIYVHNVCVGSRQSQFPFNLEVQLPTIDPYLLYIFCYTRRMKFSWWYFGLTYRKLSLQLVFEFLCQITKVLQLFAKERIFIMDTSSWVHCIFEYTL